MDKLEPGITGIRHVIIERLRSAAARAVRLNADVVILCEAAIEAAEWVEALCAEIDRLADSRSREGDRLDWLMAKLPGGVARTLIGEMSDTGDPAEWREKIDAAAGFPAPNRNRGF